MLVNNVPYFYCEKCALINQKLTELSLQYNLLGRDTQCIIKPQIDNCVEFQNDEVFSFRNFFCNFCEENYFLENNKCRSRKNLVKFCQTYFLDRDECKTCEEGFFLKEGICQQNSTGIQNCIEYTLNQACSRCDQNFYLSQNRCVPIDPL